MERLDTLQYIQFVGYSLCFEAFGAMGEVGVSRGRRVFDKPFSKWEIWRRNGGIAMEGGRRKIEGRGAG